MGRNSKHKLNRRQLLKYSGSLSVSSLPFVAVFESILLGMAERASAQSAAIPPRNFFHLFQAGAFPQWSFLEMLSPYTTANFVQNPGMGNRYVASDGRYTDTTNAFHIYKGMNVPYVWQFSAPTADGGTRPLTDLLDNFINVRGFDVKNGDHPGATVFTLNPGLASPSLSGISADQSGLPIPAVLYGVGMFKSAKGKSPSIVRTNNYGNLLVELMNPFTNNISGTMASKKALINAAFNASSGALDAYTQATFPDSAAVELNRRSTEFLLAQSFQNLGTQWSALLAKYQGLIDRALDQSIIYPGINDLPIGTTGARDGTYDASSGVPITNPDIRTIFKAETDVGQLAKSMALAEFVLVNGYSSSVSARTYNLQNLQVSGSNYHAGTDEHFTGKMLSVICNHYFNIAMGACLLELINQLKAKGIWEHTVINVGGEFGRNPRANGSGSDHGQTAQFLAMFSGAIPGP